MHTMATGVCTMRVPEHTQQPLLGTSSHCCDGRSDVQALWAVVLEGGSDVAPEAPGNMLT